MAATPVFEFRILGPLEVRADGEAISLAAHKPRAVLALLLLEANEVVSVDRLIDALWGERPPKSARAAVQVYVGQLRRLLEPSRGARAAGGVLVSEGHGYRLLVGEGALDRDRFLASSARGRERLAHGEHGEAAVELAAALALWRGAALADFAYEPWARAEAERLEELRLACLEDRLEAALRGGRHGELVGELEALVDAHPLRERPRAQLMLALYRAGRQADALAAYQDARRLLLDELGLEPGAELRELQAAILRQDASLAAPPRPPATAPTNLPTPPTPLIGRQRELGQLRVLLADRTLRLLTLTGPGGTGKTRLALQAATEAAAHYRGGVFWVGLSALRDPALVLPTIAQALEASGELAAHIGTTHLLLVLDNLEQLLDAAPELAELLSACSNLTLLVTSREPLHLYGEHEYPVSPLREPDAVMLFNARARAVGTEPSGNGEIAEICRRLDLLPLAIELAAARVKTLSASELLTRLDQRLPLLTGGARDLPERQQTLRSTIDWSYDLLTPEEQQLFERLAVFTGGCTLHAGEQLCAANLDMLQSLVDKSLLRHTGERYWMLETIREYALERLDRSNSGGLRERHAEYYLELAETGDAGLDGPEQPRWLEVLARDHANLLSAFEWALDRGNGVLAIRFAAALGWFWFLRGPVLAGRALVDRALEAAADGPDDVRATALMRAGSLAERELDFASATARYRQALELWRELGQSGRVTAALSNLGVIAYFEGDYPAARRWQEESVALGRGTDNQPGLASALCNLGLVRIAEGDPVAGQRSLEESLAIADEIGHAYGKAEVLGGLGFAAIYQHDLDRADMLLNRSLALWRELDVSAGSASVLDGLAMLALARGDAPAAARLLGAADSLLQEAGVSRSAFERQRAESMMRALSEQLDAGDLETLVRAGATARPHELVA